MEIYNEWITRRGVRIIEIDHDYDLHKLRMNLTDDVFVEIVPDSIEHMDEMRADLNNGECPYEDDWEDGNCNFIADLLDGVRY